MNTKLKIYIVLEIWKMIIIFPQEAVWYCQKGTDLGRRKLTFQSQICHFQLWDFGKVIWPLRGSVSASARWWYLEAGLMTTATVATTTIKTKKLEGISRCSTQENSWRESRHFLNILPFIWNIGKTCFDFPNLTGLPNAWWHCKDLILKIFCVNLIYWIESLETRGLVLAVGRRLALWRLQEAG